MIRSMKPPTYIELPCTAVAGPFTMLTDSTELKSRGSPLPLEVMRPRTPLMNRSAGSPNAAMPTIITGASVPPAIMALAWPSWIA